MEPWTNKFENFNLGYDGSEYSAEGKRDNLLDIDADKIIRILDNIAGDENNDKNKIKVLKVEHCRIKDDLNLSGLKAQFESCEECGIEYFKLPIELIFQDTTFEGNVDFSCFWFRERTNFVSAKFKGDITNFSHTRFEGNVSFDDARFKGETCFNNAQFKGKTYFDRAQFEGKRTYFHDAQFEGDETYFGHAQFEGDIYFSFARFKFPAIFVGVKYWSDSPRVGVAHWLYQVGQKLSILYDWGLRTWCLLQSNGLQSNKLVQFIKKILPSILKRVRWLWQDDTWCKFLRDILFLPETSPRGKPQETTI